MTIAITEKIPEIDLASEISCQATYAEDGRSCVRPAEACISYACTGRKCRARRTAFICSSCLGQSQMAVCPDHGAVLVAVTGIL